MTASPKGSIFHMHLSTAWMLMVVGSLLVWANVGYNYPDSGWPIAHGLFASHYIHGWILNLAFNAFINVLVLLSFYIICESWTRSRFNKPPFDERNVAIRSAMVCMICALLCMGLSVFLIKVLNSSAWFHYFHIRNPKHSSQVVRSILAAFPAAGIVGAALGSHAYREVNGLGKPSESVFKWSILPAIWYVSVYFLSIRHKEAVPVLVLFLPIFYWYCKKRRAVAGGGSVASYFILLAFLFCLIGFHAYHYKRSLSNFNDKIAACAYLSLWMGDATVTVMVARWRSKGWLEKPDSDAFQFSLGSMLIWMLVLGAYVSLLFKLFKRFVG